MLKTMLVVFVLMNDGTITHIISEHERTCPKDVIAKYEAQKVAFKIVDYAASCVLIRFNKRPEKPSV